jgi:hypothetical protein
MQTNYADTILNITLTGAMVRIDLGTVVPVTNADGTQEGRATQTQQLVMPLDGFVQSFGVQERVIKKLLADGVLTANAGVGQIQPQTSLVTPANGQTPVAASVSVPVTPVTPQATDKTTEGTKPTGRLSVPGKKKLM